MSSFQFLHAADIHIDSPLRGLAGLEGSAVDRVRTAPRDAFRNLVNAAIDRRVAFVVIAGDLYDGDWRDYNTGLFFAAEMGRLNEAAVPVYLLHGNHDAESRITKSLQMPPNVHVFGAAEPETHIIEDLRVALHGQSFRDRAVTDNLARAYPAPSDGCLNVGVLHTALDGSRGHDNYAPCALSDLVNKGYDYWALGHVHRAEIVHERPYVVFPGNLQGRHIRETGSKGAMLVTVDESEIADVTPMTCDVVRWIRIPVDMSSVENRGQALDAIQTALCVAAAQRTDNDRLLACRIELAGRTVAHGELIRAEESLLAEARASALGIGEGIAWVEKIAIGTEPDIDPASRSGRQDAISVLYGILDKAGQDDALIKQFRSDIGEMVQNLPASVSDDIEDASLKAAINAKNGDDYGPLIDAILPFLGARLESGET